MPSSHLHRPTAPRSDHLRVGACLVDIPLREVLRADGSRTRITAKSIGVLLVLVEHAGRVVGRDALLESVWAGTMPTDDVVTQAITLLRKALGDEREAPAYVETIPKSGYRLLAPVEWIADATAAGEAPMMGMNPDASRSAWWRRGGLALVLGVLVLAALGWVATRGEDDASPGRAATSPGTATTGEVPYTLLTSRPGPETQPALSADGALLAYAMPPGAPQDAPAIFLQAAQPTQPRQLTVPPPGHSDHLPRWSPDGRQLMFARIDDDGACELLLVPASGGATRAVGRCDRINGRYDWLPDGSGVVAGLEPDGKGKPAPLAILRLDSGRWEAMRYPMEAGSIDFDPRFSPDGTQLGFRRNLSHSDLWTMPAAGGTPRRHTDLRGNIAGWDWAPDGRSLLLGFFGSPPRLYRHDLESGQTRDLGRFPASGLDVASQRNVMAFSVDDARISMFRYALPVREPGEPEALFASTGNDLLPSPSPDGRWLAFHSDRSRDSRLWLGDPANPDQLRMVEGITPVSRHPPQWSEDGRRLLVIGATDGVGTQHGPRLYEVDAASGRARTLPVDGVPYFAQYLPGQRLLLVVDRGAGRLSLRIARDGISEAPALAQLDDVGEARFDPASGQVYLVRTNGPGLWRSGLDLRAVVRVDPAQPTAYWLRRWSIADGRPFALRTDAPACLARWHWLGGGIEPDAGCLDPGRRGVPSLAPVVSRDGKWLYASMLTGQENSDIGLSELDSLERAGKPTD